MEFVPIDPGSPPDRVGNIAADSALDLLVTSTEVAAVTAELGCPLLGAGQARCDAGRTPTPRLVASEDDGGTRRVM